MPVNLWKSAPFLRLLPPLIAGIILGMYVQPSITMIMTLFVLCGTAVLLPVMLPIVPRFALRSIQGAALLGCTGCLGMGLFYTADIRHTSQWFGHHLKDSSRLAVTLLETPFRRTRSWKAEAEVTAILEKGEVKPASGKILLYFRDTPALRYGDRLMTSAVVQRIRGTGNPGAFDYGKYCSYRNIFHQAFLRSGQWRALPGNEGNLAGRSLIRIRDHCLESLKTFVPQREEYGVAQALLIGYREELDRDIVQAYTNTGVVHIIAISGLHLGLIYITLLQLLQWLPKKRWINICKALLLIGVLWVFSLLTGASASVLRSAVMFTVIATGQLMIDRHSNTWNTLAAAAFLLLCYNPYFLVDVGFQLSFLAVGGILLCYRPLYDLWLIRNKWLDKLWQMVAVSLAAQIFTWPVCLLYFHQFPNLFLLANIIAVPLSTLLLYGAILLVSLAAVPVVNILLGKLLGWGILLMNTLILQIDRIPGAVTDGIQVDLGQTVCLYGVTILLCAWLLMKWKRGCHWALAMSVVFVGLHTLQEVQAMRCRQLIVYNIPGSSAIACISGARSAWWGDSTVRREQYLSARGGALPVSYRREGELICFEGKRLLRLTRGLRGEGPPERLKINYILLSHNSKVDISRLQEFFIYDMLIFDASSTPFQLRKWKNACNKLPLRCFSVPDEGAFVVNL